MKKILMIMIMVAAGVLPTMAQNNQEQLNVQFQSTSTLQGSGSVLSSQPMLNADGTAAYNPAEASTPDKNIRRAKKDDPTTPGTPGIGENQQPLGDAVVPMLLCASVFCGVIALRRKRSALKS